MSERIDDDLIAQAYDISELACELSDAETDDCITMYSYSRPASEFWPYFCYGLLKQGATPDEVKWILRSKLTRWMFDGGNEAFKNAAIGMATESVIREARMMIKGASNG